MDQLLPYLNNLPHRHNVPAQPPPQVPQTYSPQPQLNEQETGWTRALMNSHVDDEVNNNNNNNDDDDDDAQARATTPGPFLSHFEYALHAVIARGNTQDAIRKIRGMQRLKATYNIQDTVEEGVGAVEEFIRLQPGVLLDVDRGSTSLGSVSAWNFSNCLPAVLAESEEHWRITVVFLYYINLVQNYKLDFYLQGTTAPGQQPQPQPQGRIGVTEMIEATDFSWDNMNMDVEQRLNDEVFQHLPVKFREILVYNTNSVVNMFFTLLKRILRQEIWNAINLGCQIEPLDDVMFPQLPLELNGLLHAVLASTPRMKLDEFFLLPNYDAAMQKLLYKVRILLEERYHHEQTFRIGTATTTAATTG